jgi:hypothetical protein
MDKYEVICIKGWLHISNDKTFVLKKLYSSHWTSVLLDIIIEIHFSNLRWENDAVINIDLRKSDIKFVNMMKDIYKDDFIFEFDNYYEFKKIRKQYWREHFYKFIF